MPWSAVRSVLFAVRPSPGMPTTSTCRHAGSSASSEVRPRTRSIWVPAGTTTTRISGAVIRTAVAPAATGTIAETMVANGIPLNAVATPPGPSPISSTTSAYAPSSISVVPVKPETWVHPISPKSPSGLRVQTVNGVRG